MNQRNNKMIAAEKKALERLGDEGFTEAVGLHGRSPADSGGYFFRYRLFARTGQGAILKTQENYDSGRRKIFGVYIYYSESKA